MLNMLRGDMQAHDKFFKLIFAKVRNAADLLRSVLPAALVKYLDFDKMTDARETSLRTSSIDGQVEQRFKDLLYRLPFKEGEQVFYVLLEHKSRPEDLTTFQSHRYMVDAWSAHLANNKNATKLPDILPVVVHLGIGGWTKSIDLSEDFPVLPKEALDAIATYRVRSRFILYDAATESDAVLRQRGMNAEATLAIWAMVHAPRNKDITADFPAVLDLMNAVRDEPYGLEDFAAVVGYILEVSETPGEKIHSYLTINLGPKAEKAFMTAAEQIRQKALLHDRRANLYAILKVRGVMIPDFVRVRIDGCDDIEQLGTWLLRAVTVDSATAMLEESS